jgi:hypothetical protein
METIKVFPVSSVKTYLYRTWFLTWCPSLDAPWRPRQILRLPAMFHRPLSHLLLPLAGLVLAATVPVHAQLAAKSPFTSANAPDAASPTANAPLEFRGYMETSEGVQFRIYDPAKKTGIWVKANERNSEFGLLVKEHDLDKETLTVEHQGKPLTLSQRKSKVVSSGSAALAVPPAAAVAATPNVLPAVTQAVVLNPTPADEQRRLDAVAAEVARRRALRQQAEQQTAPGAAPQPTMAPGVQPAGNFQAAPQPMIQPQGGPGNVPGRGPNQATPR